MTVSLACFQGEMCPLFAVGSLRVKKLKLLAATGWSKEIVNCICQTKDKKIIHLNYFTIAIQLVSCTFSIAQESQITYNVKKSVCVILGVNSGCIIQ